MTLNFRNRWLRVRIEVLPISPPIRRYRVTPAAEDGAVGRLLRRRIAEAIRHRTREKPT